MRAADGAIEGVKIAGRRGRADRDRRRRARSASAARASSTPSPSSSGPGSSTAPAASSLGSSERLGKIGEENVFYLTDDVYLSQRDVRELQFAKASIATGWTILCRDLGIAPGGDRRRCCSRGSFGSYLSPASAVRIGLVPKLPLMRIVSAGNVAGEGAKIAALSVTERAAAPRRPRRGEYVELSGRTDFNDLFIDQLSFPA